MMVKIHQVNILAEEGLILNGELFIENGKIFSIGHSSGLNADTEWDGKGMLLVPGFIDLHVHGGGGYDFMDHTKDAVDAICRFHAMHGTTSLLATTMTAPLRELEQVLLFYKDGYNSSNGAQILGVHMEGPFINPRFMGAQNGEWISAPSLHNMKKLWESSGDGLIKMVTLAPELVQDPGVFSWLKDKGVVLSVGHSDLDYHSGCGCIRKGVSHVTHLGNAMRPFHHRDIGIMGLVMEKQELTFDIIADGIHVSPDFIRLLVRVCTSDQLMLITDAMRAAGLKDGSYEFGGQEVNVRRGEARLASGVLAGSLLTLDVALANIVKFTGQSLHKAVTYLTMNPASKLGLGDRKGSIKVGKDADLVMLDDLGQVRATWVAGQLVYKRGIM